MKLSQISAFAMVISTSVLLAACTIPGMSGTSTSPTPQPTPPPAVLPTNPTTVPGLKPGSSPADTTYMIEGQPVKLTDGKSEVPIPGSSTVVTTEMFGEPTTGDLNGDKIPDAAVILVQSPGGSGTFFYVAAALAQADGTYLGTNAILVGDRIAPQTTSIAIQTITFNYATRAEGEPMTAQPSQAVSAYFQVLNGALLQLPTELPAPKP